MLKSATINREEIFLLLNIINTNTMNNEKTTIVLSSRLIIGVGLIAATLLILSIPAFSYAATYAYVNNSGEVGSVVANSPESAIATAPNRSLHSGVILLDSQSDTDLVGDNVSGS